MSDEDIFDFDFEDGGNVDNSEMSSDTVPNKTAKSQAKTPRKSGKASGKRTGNVTRQQKRVPMHQRQPLSVADRDPNFEYRIVNDSPGRIDRFKLAGWVPDEVAVVGDKIAGKATAMGSVSAAPVGQGHTGVVMKIPKELYTEDQKVKQSKVDESEESMLSDSAEAINEAAGGRDEWTGEIKLGRAAATKT